MSDEYLKVTFDAPNDT